MARSEKEAGLGVASELSPVEKSRGIGDADFSRYCLEKGGAPLRFKGRVIRKEGRGIFELITTHNKNSAMWNIEVYYKGEDEDRNVLAGYCRGISIADPMSLYGGAIRSLNYETVRQAVNEILKVGNRCRSIIGAMLETKERRATYPDPDNIKYVIDEILKAASLGEGQREKEEIAARILSEGENFKTKEVTTAMLEFLSSLMPDGSTVLLQIEHGATLDKMRSGKAWVDTPFGMLYSAVGLVFRNSIGTGVELVKSKPPLVSPHIYSGIKWINPVSEDVSKGNGLEGSRSAGVLGTFPKEPDLGAQIERESQSCI